MEKLVYVSYEQGAHDLRAHLDRLDLPRAVESAALYLLDPPPDGQGPSAVLTAWLSCVDKRGPLERFLARAPAKFHGYLASETTMSPRPALPDSTRATLELMEMPDNVSNVNVWLDTLELSKDGMRDGVQFARNLLVRALSSDAPHLVLLREGVGTQARDVERSTGDRSSWLPGRTSAIPAPMNATVRTATIPPPPGEVRSTWLPGRSSTPPGGLDFAERATVPAGRVSTLPPVGGSRMSSPPPAHFGAVPTVERSSIPPRMSTLPMSGERVSHLPMPRMSTLPPGSERASQIPQRPSQLGLYANANTFTGERITLRRGQL